MEIGLSVECQEPVESLEELADWLAQDEEPWGHPDLVPARSAFRRSPHMPASPRAQCVGYSLASR